MSPPTPLFLGWEEPWLPRLAEQLLLKGYDLANTIVILPGKRAGRRLLELLALRAQEQGALLVPPRIVTLEEAIPLLLSLPDVTPEAGALTQRLAWRMAAASLSDKDLKNIQRFPEGLTTTEKETACHRLASLAEKLASELSHGGLTIPMVAKKIGQLMPESAEQEEPRWEALARLENSYHHLLQEWGFCDHFQAQGQRLLHGVITTDYQVIVAGVADYSPFFEPFFEKVKPHVIIIAPESHAGGFHHFGKIIPSYWHQHPATVEESSLIACERSSDQASKTLKLLTSWKHRLEISETQPEQMIASSREREDGEQKKPLSNLITIVAPEQEALTLLREKCALASWPTRWAGGRFFRGGSLFALLDALKEYLLRAPSQAPSLKAVSLLLRHPAMSRLLDNLLPSSCEQLIKQLDAWERDHLPQALEKEHLRRFHQQAPLLDLLDTLEEIIPFSLAPASLSLFLLTLKNFLKRCFEQDMVQRHTDEGHYFLGCLEKLLFLLEEIEQLSLQTTSLWKASDLLNLLLELLSNEAIPEREKSDAIEILGWLEAAADDTPCLLLTSFHEGAIPEAIPSDPLLPEGLRKALHLPQQEDRLARDHYYLHIIVASRKKEGTATFLAPRYNGRGEPVRPSRLLLQGCKDDALPARVLLLTQRHHSSLEKEKSLARQHSLLQPRPILPERKDRLTVTAFRAYLQSPRLFYLQHVLKLQEILETPLEMNARQFGTLLHTILGRLGAEHSLRKVTDPRVLTNWLHQQLKKTLEDQFGKHPSAAVWSQQEELAATLTGFAMAETVHRKQGWITIATEESSSHTHSLLEETLHLQDGRSLILQGRIDRVDWHPEKQRWLLLDYKTSHRQEWKKQTPNQEHYQKKGELVIWKDLQLPLYLKLAPHLEAIHKSGLPPPTSENTDLSYFQLPLDPDAAGISERFDTAMIEPAWQEAERLTGLILDSDFHELGNITPEQSPTFAALCGLAGLWRPSSSAQQEELQTNGIS